jgi:hypothetical protein
MNNVAPDNDSSLQAETANGGATWKFALLGALASRSAPRVLTAASFHALAQTIRPQVNRATSRELVGHFLRAGVLRRVTSGTYLNRRALPPAELYEAAPIIRKGAVLSLHSVLGEAGVLNNPSRIITCILPTSKILLPRLGELETEAGIFRFYGLTERFFPKTSEDEREMLQPGRPCAVFRPEVALLQWLHLASLKRSSLSDLPLDLDLELLDLDLVVRLGERLRVLPLWQAWYEKAKAANFGAE